MVILNKHLSQYRSHPLHAIRDSLAPVSFPLASMSLIPTRDLETIDCPAPILYRNLGTQTALAVNSAANPRVFDAFVACCASAVVIFIVCICGRHCLFRVGTFNGTFHSHTCNIGAGRTPLALTFHSSSRRSYLSSLFVILNAEALWSKTPMAKIEAIFMAVNGWVR